MTAALIILVVVLAFVFIVLAMSLKIIRPWQKGLVERLGRFKRTAMPGLTLIYPGIDTMRRVDMREQVVDVPPQSVITQDNVLVSVDAVVYYEVTDPVKVTYNIADFSMASTKLAQTNLRNLVGDMELDKCLTSREVINTQLRQILDDATDAWGVKVTRVELQRIDPPIDVTEAMHRQMKAERDRRAKILEAEGDKASFILNAEGEKQSKILRAEGEMESMMRVADGIKYRKVIEAEGEATAIEQVFNAIHVGGPTSDLIAIKYLDALTKVANGKATKLFLPMETAGILGSVASIGELFKDDGKPAGSE